MSDTLPDFDTLRRLAKRDPQGLEKLRERLVQDVIEAAPEAHRPRLRGIQFQVDMERRRASNPLSACIRISSMMRDSLVRLQSAIQQPQALRAEAKPQAAEILVLRRGNAS